jgi:hypothetical protein
LEKSRDAISSEDESDRLHKSLASIGVDREAAKRLTSSKHLEHIVVPIYRKDGLASRSSRMWLVKLPELLRSFAREFPDGEIRWDSDYQGSVPAEDVAIRVFFNIQEDDQGGRFQPKPTPMEEEAYQRMLERSSYKGAKPVPAYLVLHGK